MLHYDTKRMSVENFKDTGFLNINEVFDKYSDNPNDILEICLLDYLLELEEAGIEFESYRGPISKLFDYLYTQDGMLTPDTYLFYVLDSGLVVQVNTVTGTVDSFWRSHSIAYADISKEDFSTEMQNALWTAGEITALLSQVAAKALNIEPLFEYEALPHYTEEQREAHARACDIDDAING